MTDNVDEIVGSTFENWEEIVVRTFADGSPHLAIWEEKTLVKYDDDGRHDDCPGCCHCGSYDYVGELYKTSGGWFLMCEHILRSRNRPKAWEDVLAVGDTMDACIDAYIASQSDSH